MSPTVYLAMLGIIPFGQWLMGKYPARRAVAAIFVIGWILLPQAKFDIPVLPDYTKGNAMGLAALFAVMAKDSQIFKTFRFKWIDIPMVCWCAAPFCSSVANGIGAWDGVSAALANIFGWGLPYFIGRLYFGSLEGLRELGIAMFIGGLAIAPLALVEMIISPQMHILVYGWYPHDFSQTKRGEGYRPSVFMAHGLELAMWNAAAAFIGCQLYLRKVLDKTVPFLKIPLFPAAAGLVLVLVFSRSSGALLLFLLGMGVFQAAVVLRSRLPLLLLLLMPILYMNLRTTGAWDGQSLIEVAGKVTGNVERTGSLGYRLYNESLLIEKAKMRPVFGWAGYKRSFVTNSEGDYISVPDGMWILTLGKNGLFGLTALTASVLLAPLIFFLRVPGKLIGDARVATAAAFATFLGVFMADNLINAMYNPLMMLAAGGLAALVLQKNPWTMLKAHATDLAPEPVNPSVVTRVI